MTAKDCYPVGTQLPVSQAPQVMIACPVYSAPMAEFVASLMQVLPVAFSRVSWHSGDSLITRARNNIADEFMKTEIPYLLFLDTDLVFEADAVKRLINWPATYPIIGGCYPKKKVGPPEWIFNPLATSVVQSDGLVEVAEVGTGMLRIHRSVFAALREAYPQLRYRCDGNRDIRYDFFPVGPWRDLATDRKEEARYLSEDWYICQLARQIGYRVYADTKVTAGHIGRVMYPFPDPTKADATVPIMTAPASGDSVTVPRSVQIVGDLGAMSPIVRK